MKRNLNIALLGLGLAAPVFAQGTVTIYGLLDAGPSRVSNQNGSSVTKLDDGVYTPSLLGFRGSEDLGDGVQALFLLETQLELGTGGTIPTPSMFWRQSYVGLSSPRLGKLTLGNQFDFMWDNLAPALNDPAVLAGGLYNFSGGPFAKLGIPKNLTGGLDWDRTAGDRVANTVKYETPSFGGFVLGGLYGFSEGQGDRTVSVGARYSDGPLGIGAAYTKVDYRLPGVPEVSIRNWGLGGHYVFGAVIGSALVTSVRNEQSGASVHQARVGAKWSFSGPWAVGAAYAYMKGNAQVDDNHAHQVGTTLSYSFSKRTIAYVQGVYQKANAGAKAHIMGVMDPLGASSTSSQSILRIGVWTAF